MRSREFVGESTPREGEKAQSHVWSREVKGRISSTLAAPLPDDPLTSLPSFILSFLLTMAYQAGGYGGGYKRPGEDFGGPPAKRFRPESSGGGGGPEATVWLGNLPYDVTEEEIAQIFRRCAPLTPSPCLVILPPQPALASLPRPLPPFSSKCFDFLRN